MQHLLSSIIKHSFSVGLEAEHHVAVGMNCTHEQVEQIWGNHYLMRVLMLLTYVTEDEEPELSGAKTLD